jgi:hypothetical protein
VQPLDIFSEIYGTRMLITALTRTIHLYLSRARPSQSKPTQPISTRSISILSTHLRLGHPSGRFPFGFPTNNLYTVFYFPHSIYMSYPPHPPRLDNSNYNWRRVQIVQSSVCSFLHPPIALSLFVPNIFVSSLFSNTLSRCKI